MAGEHEALIQALQAFMGTLDAPAQHAATLEQFQPPPDASAAIAALQGCMGNIPLRVDHPRWGEISGAIMEATGHLEYIQNELSQQITQTAAQAQQMIQQAYQAADAAISELS